MFKRVACFVLMGAALVACGGCAAGPEVRETLPPVAPVAAADQLERVVVLPLADSTSSSSAYTYAERGEMVERILHEELYNVGFYPVPRDDVLFFLSGQGVVRVYGSVSPETEMLQQEVREGDWSETMKGELRHAIDINQQTGVAGDRFPAGVRMDQHLLSTMGRAFEAAYVMRGGVAFFGIRSEDSFDPLQIGLFPLIFKSGGRTFFGAVDPGSREADEGFLSVGARGRVPNAAVYLWLKAQDPETGETFWMNRVEVRSSRKSVYHVPEQDELFEASVRRAASALLSDFLKAAADYRERLATQEIPAAEVSSPSYQAPGAGEAAQALKAAEEARQAALEAREAAEQAGESARKVEKMFDKILAK